MEWLKAGFSTVEVYINRCDRLRDLDVKGVLNFITQVEPKLRAHMSKTSLDVLRLLVTRDLHHIIDTVNELHQLNAPAGNYRLHVPTYAAERYSSLITLLTLHSMYIAG